MGSAPQTLAHQGNGIEKVAHSFCQNRGLGPIELAPGQARVIPGGGRGDLHAAFSLAVPVGDRNPFQSVTKSSATGANVGSRAPFLRGLPFCPGLRDGAG
jgi:hypothetical protein